jgi:hypothetical protein
MSHVLTVVADSTDALKAVLTSEAYCREWSASLAPHARKIVSFTSPLGLDLVHAKKRDPMLVMHGLQLKEVKEDSDEYGKMMKAIEAISKLPGTMRLWWGNVRYVRIFQDMSGKSIGLGSLGIRFTMLQLLGL